MVRSMTGYGRAEETCGGRTVTVELRAVNNRYLDCSVRLPRLYLFAEDAVKARIQKVVARGKVDVFVTIENGDGEAVTVRVNRSVAESYRAALEELGTLCGIPETVIPSQLARFPDVLLVEKEQPDTEEVAAQIDAALVRALEDFDRMRCREGERLVEDIRARAQTIAQLLSKVEERSPQTVNEYRLRLESRIAEVLADRQIDPARILTEAAIFADKIAVDEETVRLHSHLTQLEEMLSAGGAIGRKLDFLIQEFNREANTIGSKCSDIQIARWVVDIKGEIEKIREQVQNIE